MSENLDTQVEIARSILCEAGCTPLARVRAAVGVMDMVFFTAQGASLLVRCSLKRSRTSDLAALTTIHQQRTFDHVVLLNQKSEQLAFAPTIISFAELPAKASDLAKLRPGWAI